MSSFVDTNVPIYAVGREHPYKAPCLEVLRLVVAHPTAFVTDAEVLQEILHRFRAIRRVADGLRTLEYFIEVMQGSVAPMLVADVLSAASLMLSYPQLQARDLVHIAVMRRLGVTQVISTDRGFDAVPGIERLDPARVHEWRDRVTAQG